MKYNTYKTKIFRGWYNTEAEALRAGIPARLLTKRGQFYGFDSVKAAQAGESYRCDGRGFVWYFESVTIDVP